MEHEATPVQPFGLLLEPKQSLDNLCDLDIDHLRELVRREHLIVLRGFHTFQDAESFANYCERWGRISIWPFGKVLELIEQENPEDHIFDNNYVPLHWDGMYRPEIPEFQMFHCVRAPLAQHGGRTTFSNTVIALREASAHDRSLWHKVTGHYQRKMEFYDSKTVSPVIASHPDRGFSVIRYNEPPSEKNGHRFVNPPVLSFSGIEVDELEEFHSSLRNALYAPASFYAHEWRVGDVVIADNYTLLHGREAFVTRSPRHLRRVHVLGNPPYVNPGLVSHQ